MKRILFVDDEPFIQHAVRRCFEKQGYEIEVFSDGTPFENDNYKLPDIFILDKQLPVGDGIEICRKLKSDQKTKDIPVIMVSAHPDIKSLAKIAGAENSIEKPFSLNRLKEMVADYVS